MENEYVEQRDSVYLVTGTRVSLDSIVHAFAAGESAESIAQAFPVLRLEQVYGAITFYLAHRAELEEYLAIRQQQFDDQREAVLREDPMFYRKLADAKKRTALPR